MSRHKQVIYMYRSILRVANSWENINQKEDIRNECRNTFQKYKDLEDNEEIDSKIEEARARLLLALHYKIPYEKKKYNLHLNTMKPSNEQDESNIN
ncbi:LYR motif-containing protein 1 [Tieghemostelium lacteum]|uniref:LYR motif-containing protein 1 n=1 Tax=Tieghemostelium lacteum TaxID=361077 RepID=A0A152A0N0_TIELA|nr:LYR motif-containing protein 1 [Tieghemostelium lacteum]|eukprot:KYQ99769.1 LYR motif-containing protein 1 [Tieghemostelium lacteum]